MAFFNIPPFVKVSVPIVLTYTHGAANTTSGTTQTFSAVNFGTASATRKIVIGVGMAGAPTISSATIGGVSATITSATNLAADNSWRTTFIVADVPTTTSGTVVINYSAANARAAIDVWGMTDASSSTPTTFKVDANHATVCSNTIVIPVNGCCACVISAVGQSGNYRTITWTNATERSDRAILSDFGQSAADTSTAGSTLITATASAAWNNSVGDNFVCAAWSPS